MGLAFVAGLLAGVSLPGFLGGQGFLASPTGEETASAKEIFSVLPDEIMSLTYSIPALALTAQRSRPGARFAVQVTFADGGTPQQCVSSPDLAGQLVHLAAPEVRRRVQADRLEAEFPASLGTLELKDGVANEVLSALSFRSTADRQAVALTYEGRSMELATPSEVFAKLEAGCDALAAP